ncbi:hypothetical protein N7532_003793 [Penicillium argentinense]|uniref:Uncharacterized protein n=1 Tax=Penicillium argentinense TaxID=1131581 RepID=A0A9W9FN86_9EURO|nr:uncharacterized protein N7532_003793 [Penicillium argentinense]KAJ5103264.1 hypothetical protein N7532_003793 [Penicillium argentinense]
MTSPRGDPTHTCSSGAALIADRHTGSGGSPQSHDPDADAAADANANASAERAISPAPSKDQHAGNKNTVNRTTAIPTSSAHLTDPRIVGDPIQIPSHLPSEPDVAAASGPSRLDVSAADVLPTVPMKRCCFLVLPSRHNGIFALNRGYEGFAGHSDVFYHYRNRGYISLPGQLEWPFSARRSGNSGLGIHGSEVWFTNGLENPGSDDMGFPTSDGPGIPHEIAFTHRVCKTACRMESVGTRGQNAGLDQFCIN